METNDWLLLLAFSLAAALITCGVLLISVPSGFIVSGILVTLLAILFLIETGGRS